MKSVIYLFIVTLGLSTASFAADSTSTTHDLNRERIMAPGMWHKISNGDPIIDSTIKEAAYIVLSDDKRGHSSFQIALVPGDDVVKSLAGFQKITGITSGKGVAVFNINSIELDQWKRHTDQDPSTYAPNHIQKGREGLLIALFSGAIKGSPAGEAPGPHIHAMVAGFDDTPPGSKYEGGFPAVGGHLGAAKVNIVLEMHVDSYPEVLEKAYSESLGGPVLSISDRQAEAARQFLERAQMDNSSPSDMIIPFLGNWQGNVDFVSPDGELKKMPGSQVSYEIVDSNSFKMKINYLDPATGQVVRKIDLLAVADKTNADRFSIDGMISEGTDSTPLKGTLRKIDEGTILNTFSAALGGKPAYFHEMISLATDAKGKPLTVRAVQVFDAGKCREYLGTRLMREEKITDGN